MEAWVNVFSFIMKSMLPPAIKGQTLETEICINTKTEFSSDNMKAQVQEIKYEREKALSSYRSNRTPNNTNRITTPTVVTSNKNNKNDENGYDKSNSFHVFLPKLPLVISDKNDDDL